MEYFPAIFEPGVIGGIRVKNRIIMAAVATNFTSDQGGVTQRLVDFYTERARGGTAVVVVENTNVDFPEGTNGATQLRLDEDRFIPGLSYLAESIQRAGARAVLQINHGGPTSKSAKIGGLQPVGPSAANWPPLGEMPRPLAAAEIERMAAKFASAAARAKKAGFDGVEVHGGHSYLLGSFISPYTNKRADEFGGSLANRMRFPLLVLAGVRAAVGAAYPLFFRYSADEFLPGGLTLDEGIVIATMLEAAGVDLISVSAGTRSSLNKMVEPMSYPEGWRTYLAAAIKERVRVPVATCGNIKTPQLAEQILAAGQADFVALARALVADPYWVQKAVTGRAAAIDRCLSCNIGCTERRVYQDLPIACTINPRVGWEGRPVPALSPAQRVLVVGGGPAGMEAAVRLKERGHDVLLVERAPALGGQLRLAVVSPSKAKLSWYLDAIRERVQAVGVPLRLGVSADRALIEEFRPDIVVVATGSVASQPFPAGPKVRTAREVLAMERAISAAKVVIVGGGSVGCECAEHLAELGNDVTVLEMTASLAADLDVSSRVDLLERLAERKVKLLTGCRVLKVDDGEIDYRIGEEEEVHAEADLVVVAVGARPDTSFEKTLREVGVKRYYIVGDADRPAKLIDAVARASSLAETI